MKNTFFLKLAIAIILIFGVLIAGFVFWKPLCIQYYKYRIGSENPETHAAAVKYLLDADAVQPVRYYYENKYASKDVKARLAVVDELCAVGDKGKELMREIFRERCKREMVLIPAGSFMMGSENGEEDEKPVHKVSLSEFWMDKYEVTNEKYYVFVKCTNHEQPEHWQPGIIPNEGEMHPVILVTWKDANAYAKWMEMRLPSEAEWEYACRAGSNNDFYFGDNVAMLEEYAWFSDNFDGDTHPVGMKKPNNWNLYDMLGNAYEWCQDWYAADYYANSSTTNPGGPSGGECRVLRGGGWYFPAHLCRSACRNRYLDFHPVSGHGFRVAFSAP